MFASHSQDCGIEYFCRYIMREKTKVNRWLAKMFQSIIMHTFLVWCHWSPSLLAISLMLAKFNLTHIIDSWRLLLPTYLLHINGQVWLHRSSHQHQKQHQQQKQHQKQLTVLNIFRNCSSQWIAHRPKIIYPKHFAAKWAMKRSSSCTRPLALCICHIPIFDNPRSSLV